VEQCQQVGLVWGQELYIDATKMEANASLDSLTPRFAVEAHLAYKLYELPIFYSHLMQKHSCPL